MLSSLQVQNDFRIWTNQTYVQKPLFVGAEREWYVKLRLWARQFYTSPTPTTETGYLWTKKWRSRSDVGARRYTYEHILWEGPDADGVAVLTFNRPDVRNAFNEEMYAEVTDVLRGLRSADHIGACWSPVLARPSAREEISA